MADHRRVPLRLVEDLTTIPGEIDDKGLKFAEAICHEQRQAEERALGRATERTLRAIDALAGIRTFTKVS